MQNISICNKCQGVKWLDDNKQVVRDAARVGVMGECGIPLSFCTRFESHQSFISATSPYRYECPEHARRSTCIYVIYYRKMKDVSNIDKHFIICGLFALPVIDRGSLAANRQRDSPREDCAALTGGAREFLRHDCGGGA